MTDPYRAPATSVADVASSENNSGEGKGSEPPPGVKGWSWGAFFFNWIWAIANKTWIGLLALVPYIGFVAAIYLGVKGRELAWQNKRWDSLEHFNRVQRLWSMWALIVFAGVFVLVFIAVIVAAAFSR